MEDTKKIVEEFLDEMIESAVTAIEGKPAEKPQEKPRKRSKLIDLAVQMHRGTIKRANPVVIYGDLIQKPASKSYANPSWNDEFGKSKLEDSLAAPITVPYLNSQQYKTSTKGINSSGDPAWNKNFGEIGSGPTNLSAKDHNSSNVNQQSQVPQEADRHVIRSKTRVPFSKSSINNILKYDWKRTEVPIIERLPRHVIKSFEPRMRPRFFNVHIGKQIVSMQNTEYLIGYCNGFTAVGVIKHHRDIGGKPLTVQFGNYGAFDGKNLHVGTTVIVKSYAQIYNPATGYFRPHSTKENAFDDLKKGESLYSYAQATEWAIVNKPEVVTSLGTLKRMFVERMGDFLLFCGRIYDQENNLVRTLSDDFWPSYIKKAPEVNDAILIRWIKLEEPYMIYSCNKHFQIVLPGYAEHYLKGEKKEDNYWLAWIDSCFIHKYIIIVLNEVI